MLPASGEVHPAPPPPVAERRPFRDNPRLLLLGIALLIAALVAMVTLADRSTELNPDFLSEVVLYAVSAADLTMLVVLAFVLARNVVKLMVERRRGLPFSRFRAKLVLAMLGLTIVPSVLVLIVGGELIRSSTERWLRVPIDETDLVATVLLVVILGIELANKGWRQSALRRLLCKRDQSTRTDLFYMVLSLTGWGRLPLPLRHLA